MSLEFRVKEEPLQAEEEEAGQINGGDPVQRGVTVYIKEEPPSWESCAAALTRPLHHIKEEVAWTGSTADATVPPDVATVRVKREIEEEDATREEEEEGETVYEITLELERIDDKAECERGVRNTSPSAQVADPREGDQHERGEAGTNTEVRDDSAAEATAERTERQQKKRKTKENGAASKSRRKRRTGPHLCHVCHKEFTRANKLLIHQRTHTGEKPYPCTVCDKRFSFSNGLKIHMRTHTGDKPYVCRTCDRSFGQWNSLKAHERIHTGEKPYACDICKKTFTQRINLKTHQLRSHKSEVVRLPRV
ncbi:zinc finger protein 572-like [Leguminivora glycinivorella]|uniref:zinc finger protein 572-like n=1 Tax=Leguminivora glycinivorella TaxID=1035111 RepID=UPI00200E6DA9|nr:zinc finger protein 572-like [Leguminivora glycinivorella]